ncbi:MAG: ribonuclease H-like domain-containing protein [Candidatus Aminicenantaceae bacterium]
MSDIKDKLKYLKQERRRRPKLERIKNAWEEIEKKNDLTTKEKLDQLINLTGRQREEKIKTEPLEQVNKEPLKYFENSYPLDKRYGRITLSSGLEISGEILACLSREKEFESLDLSSALFIDLETTGLSGGVGIIPFLVGMGYYRGDKFHISMYFLGEPAEEEQMIQELSQFFLDMDFKSIITYNGKVYDLPLLENRFIMHRKPFSINELPHLDFLFPARSLWAHKLENCRLSNLAREILKTYREEDIPSAEIPWRYYQYLNTGNFDLIEPVIYHNEEDILSLLGGLIAGSLILSQEGEECLEDAVDLFGAGKVMERIGDLKKSEDFFKRALKGKLPEHLSLLTKKKLSYYLKKNQKWEQAVSIWEEIASSEQILDRHLFSFRELAMYFEHRAKQYEKAKKIAEEGLVVSSELSLHYKRDFSHRIERLNKKLKLYHNPDGDE